MIVSPSYNIPQGVNSGVFSYNTGKYCAEVEKLISVALYKGYILPTDYQLRCLDVLIKELISNKIFQTYDILYVYGYNTLLKYGPKDADVTTYFPTGNGYNRPDFEKFTLLNITNPERFEATIVKSPSRNNYPFLNELGHTMGRSGIDFGAIDTGWIAKDHAVKWQLNNAGAFIYTHAFQEVGGQPAFGVHDSTVNRTTVSLQTNNSGAVTGRINGTVTNRTYVASGITSGAGHHRLERTGATASQYYRDGLQLGTSTGTGGTMLGTYSVFMGGFSNNGARGSCNTGPISFGGLGSSIGQTLSKIEYDIFTSFRQKLNLI
jgi:hypothetical protein